MDVRRQVPRTDVVLAALPDTATSLRPVHPVLPDEPDAALRDAVRACMS